MAEVGTHIERLLMIILENAQDVVDIYVAAGHPLDEESLESLEYVRQQLIDEGLPSKFAIIDIRCRICNYEQVAIVPEIVDLDNIQCGNCENMAAMEKDDEEYPDYPEH